MIDPLFLPLMCVTMAPVLFYFLGAIIVGQFFRIKESCSAP